MILATADLHLNANPRDAYRHTFMVETLPHLLKKYEIQRLLILGDLTDDKDAHRAGLVNQVVAHIHKLSLICNVTILKGNHDYVEASNPFFEFLKRIPNVVWVNNPLETQYLKIGKVLWLPHTINYKRDWKGLNFKGFKHIFAHQTFQGAAVGPRKLDGIPLETFPDNTRVISGDIHVPQTFDVVTYVGAPYLCDFGDSYKPRVLLWDEDNWQSIPVPGIQKRLVEINSLAELKQQSMLNRGDILKVRVALKAEDHARWPEMKDKVEKWGQDNGYQIYLVQPQVEKEKGKATARRRTVAHTDDELMNTYAKARAVNETTLATGLGIMRRV